MTEACKVRVSLSYLDDGIVVPRRTLVPYKWRAECSCGWFGISWSWDREWECYSSSRWTHTDGPDPEQWKVENGEPVGGALPMALQHVGLAS